MECRVCDSTDLELVLDLGQHPWCNHFLKPAEIGTEMHYPLRLMYCHDCSTSQLDYTVKKEIMFSDHTYVSGTTKTLGNHFRQVAIDVDQRFYSDQAIKSVMDIGSNDGTQLQHFKELGYDVLGVESSQSIAEQANTNGIPTANDFFNYEFAKRLDRKFDLINAAGVFFHLEELHSVTEGLRECLKDDGIFVVQFLYMKCIQDNTAFDQIYHEHLLYYNLHNIDILLNRHGLSLFDAYLAPIHGGSIIGFVSHKGYWQPSNRLKGLIAKEDSAASNRFSTYQDFATRVKRLKQENQQYLIELKNHGKAVYGLGAPAKGNTLLNYFEIGPNLIKYLVEKNDLRKGLVSPGRYIPIILEEDIIDQPDVYYVLAWNFRKEIMENNKHLLEQGIEFHFPINPRDII